MAVQSVLVFSEPQVSWELETDLVGNSQVHVVSGQGCFSVQEEEFISFILFD